MNSIDKIDKIKEHYNNLDIYKEYDLGKLERLGIDIDPHKYDFVFSHIPVGKMIKMPEHFNFSVLFDQPQQTSFYIHIPFCLRECAYCYFIKDVGEKVRCFKEKGNFPQGKLHTQPSIYDKDKWHKLGLIDGDRVSEYLYYLKREFDIFREYFKHWNKIDSIYIGGGTPSFLYDYELNFLFENIVNPIKNKIGNDGVEIAMEIHPELMAVEYKRDRLHNFNTVKDLNIDNSKLDKILKLGVNRLSFGIQTFDEKILAKINRDNRGHVDLAKKLKEKDFNNWNLDMIYGLPGQNLDTLAQDIKQVLELNPPSITWYQLWYLPRKKEREIKLRGRGFEDSLPSKKDIIRFKLFIHDILIKNNYKNISGDWYVKEERFYTQYEKDKVEAHGNIGIGIGVYQYYGNYIFENSSGNGYGDNLDWLEYYNKIKENKLPITWLRKVDESELYLRKMIMGLKGKEKPESINIGEIEKHFKNNNKLEHITKRIEKLVDNEIFNQENGKLKLNENYWLFRDYIIIYLLEKYGWNIEKSGLLESLDGVDVYKAKDTFYRDAFPKILKKRESVELKPGKISIAFFSPVFNEDIADYDLNFSSNYILEKDKYSLSKKNDAYEEKYVLLADVVILKKKISSGDLLRNSFSFLDTFYSRPGNLRIPICIRVNDNERDDPFDIPNIKLNDIEKDLDSFLKAIELNYPEKKRKNNFDFVKEYYKNLAKELLGECNKIYVYHIPFFENYGVGGIELALDEVLSKKDLISIKNDLLPFFVDRISQEINAYENYNINKHALKSAISSIMARNLSHIHGSHIEPGIQNRMNDFEKLLGERIEKMYKEIINGNKDAIIQIAIKKAHEHLSKYRQGKQDLIARMATDWPEWSCALDFYTSFIYPLLKNSIVLNFINHSDKVDLSNMDIEFYFGGKEESGNIILKRFKEEIVFDSKKISAKLIDYAIRYVPEVEKKIIYVENENKEVHLVSVRDADIGVHAFFSLFEGIIRNAAKHKEKDRDDKQFIIKIIFWENLADLYLLIDKTPLTEVNVFSGVTISVNFDFFNNKDGNPREIVDQNDKKNKKDLVKFLNERMNEEIIDRTTGRLNPGHWGLKEIKSCGAFLSGKKIQDVNSKKVDDYLIIDKTAKLWNDAQARLFYTIKLEKPRLILAVLPSSELPTDNIINLWRNFGINIIDVSKLKDGTISRDYDFLITTDNLSDEEKQDLQTTIKDENSKLPQRKIINFKSNIEFGKPSEVSAFKLIESIYDEWFKKINLSENTKLLINFDDPGKPDLWTTNFGSPKYFFPKQDNNDDGWKNFAEKLSNTDNIFIISRHKNYENIKTKLFLSDKKDYEYFEELSYSDLFFSFLMSLEPGSSLAKMVIKKILESCYLKILVIDERIAQTLENNLDKIQKLKKMRIEIAKEAKIKGTDEKRKEKVETFKFISDNNEDLVTVDFDDYEKLSDYNIILIHATRLNEIYDSISNDYKSKEEFISKLKEKVKNKNLGKFFNIIVHSGRGKTEGDIPTNTPFLEYSIVQKYLIQEPSKFYLTQISLSVK